MEKIREVRQAKDGISQALEHTLNMEVSTRFFVQEGNLKASSLRVDYNYILTDNIGEP